jgi:hypothetical protein
MKKIVAAFDGLRFSESTLRQSIMISKNRQAHLVAVFLHEFYQPGYLFAENIMIGNTNGKNIIEALYHQDAETFKQSIQRFEDACCDEWIEYTIHREKKSSLKSLVHESLFADLMVIDPRDSFSALDSKEPSWFGHVLLKEAQCPVLAVSKHPHEPHRPVFLYDGHPSSIYAMKMFTYLFPELRDEDAEIITVKSPTLNLHVPNHTLVHEWVKRHYTKAGFTSVPGDTQHLIQMLKERDNDRIIVTGAYDRSRLSMFLIPSLADDIITGVKSPVFIAHT